MTRYLGSHDYFCADPSHLDFDVQAFQIYRHEKVPFSLFCCTGQLAAGHVHVYLSRRPASDSCVVQEPASLSYLTLVGAGAHRGQGLSYCLWESVASPSSPSSSSSSTVTGNRTMIDLSTWKSSSPRSLVQDPRSSTPCFRRCRS